mmetsp:Transcript_59523/g.119495  ORF Transcript_59523/g.119495 Transcript_59523/m.119495 type:complete len:322 (-) Transcript_59523:383-1348(-)
MVTTWLPTPTGLSRRRVTTFMPSPPGLPVFSPRSRAPRSAEVAICMSASEGGAGGAMGTRAARPSRLDASPLAAAVKAAGGGHGNWPVGEKQSERGGLAEELPAEVGEMERPRLRTGVPMRLALPCFSFWSSRRFWLARAWRAANFSFFALAEKSSRALTAAYLSEALMPAAFSASAVLVAAARASASAAFFSEPALSFCALDSFRSFTASTFGTASWAPRAERCFLAESARSAAWACLFSFISLVKEMDASSSCRKDSTFVFAIAAPFFAADNLWASARARASWILRAVSALSLSAASSLAFFTWSALDNLSAAVFFWAL